MIIISIQCAFNPLNCLIINALIEVQLGLPKLLGPPKYLGIHELLGAVKFLGEHLLLGVSELVREIEFLEVKVLFINVC